ncbi:glucokinase [Paremcibacter congregatus]|uniref:glucokinase n=1 Tax=Paremcibacter congregatus TaxID=2043170 RepID=UPI0030ED7647|tara:strand:- start:1283 stop:2287 length:1005 start_codon:yes stop_codon:yes gene_type:complete
MTRLTNAPLLVADIGGTNTRIALAHVDQDEARALHVELHNLVILPTASFDTPEAVFSSYLSTTTGEKPQRAVIAAAAPVVEDNIQLVDYPWSFSGDSMKKALKMQDVQIMNDFAAIACAIPHLSDDQFFQIGGGQKVASGPAVVVGPGTGLGMAALTPLDDKWKIFSSEGGNICFAPTNRLEFEVMEIIKQQHPRVSVERLLSGQGLVALYRALAHLDKMPPASLTPEEITRKALENSDQTCTKTLDLFSALLGRFASDMALVFNATGGIYLAGGILPRIEDYFRNSGFRDSFESKGRLTYVKAIPTYQILEQQPALIGAAAWAVSPALYHEDM